MTPTTLPRASTPSKPRTLTPAADLPGGQSCLGTQRRPAAGSLAPDQPQYDDQGPLVGGSLTSDHAASGSHGTSVAGLFPPANVDPSPNDHAPGEHLAADHTSSDTHAPDVGGNTLRGIDQVQADTQPNGVDPALTFYAALLDDIEGLRKATENRARSLAAEGVPTQAYEQTVEALAAMEHQAVLALQRAMRKHPYGPWVKATIGVGEKQGARLLAAIGDPCWNALDERPRRGPAELWAYCGYAPDQKRRKGVKANWNADAKMRAHLIAESCIKQMHSPYRPVYDAARLAWADRDTSELHKHNHALRRVAKEILKDLWRYGHNLNVGR